MAMPGALRAAQSARWRGSRTRTYHRFESTRSGQRSVSLVAPSPPRRHRRNPHAHCPETSEATYGLLIRVYWTCRENRVTTVEQDLPIGSEWQLQDALERSEDSERLNTSFVERLNLTIRQGSAYLQRRSP